ncbi:hypothetical protein M9Y10_000475 [Tritrichomonas musculus]|uniref:DUF362 domain-containing protein n=1 Tax=Tritrichomonas musculus TaxID=1915356 RepID=A0ABR2L5C9_9EUKA
MSKSKVYFTKEITPESLIRIYDALGRELQGKICVKISTGEPGGHNFLSPDLIKGLVNKVDGTIVECLTAYRGKRNTVEAHKQTFKDHGFADIAPCELLDEEGTMKIPIEGGKHLKGYDIVGSRMPNYKSSIILSHFKGHMAAGFGGALKNMSIGFASAAGKAWIHSSGKTENNILMFVGFLQQDAFLESMAEACKGVIDFFKPENLCYINVANKLSVDCDCSSHPKDPEMKDIGIFASLDPVAIDQCCYDQVINSSDEGKASLVKRMNGRHGIHVVEEACRLGLGSREYELIDIDN